MSLDIDIRLPARGVDLALSVADGSTTAVLGANGSGKSTLLAAVGGLLEPAHGTVRFRDRVLSSTLGTPTWVPPHRRRITMLTQDPRLFPHLDVVDNVAFGLRSAGRRTSVARRLARGWLDRVDAGHLADRRPGTLSGGQAQRVGLARALATEPDVLLLDEPFAALDVAAAPELRRVLAEHLAGVTTLLVTHDLVDAVVLADHVAVLDAGRVAEVGPTADLVARPQSAAAARVVGLNLIADGELRRAFRPSAVRLRRTPPATTVVARPTTVEALEPHGDYIRVRCTELLADLAPTDVGDLVPGDRVWWDVDDAQVTVYPGLG